MEQNINQANQVNVNTQGVKKTIKFVPQIATMEMSSKDFEKVLNTNLQQKIPGVWSRLRFDKGALYCEISVSPDSGIFKENILAARGLKTDMGYELTDEAKAMLSDYLNPAAPIPTFEIGGRKKHSRAAVVIQLDVLKTFEALMEKNPADYTYSITNIRSVPKSNITYVQISRIAKPVQK